MRHNHPRQIAIAALAALALTLGGCNLTGGQNSSRQTNGSEGRSGGGGALGGIMKSGGGNGQAAADRSADAAAPTSGDSGGGKPDSGPGGTAAAPAPPSPPANQAPRDSYDRRVQIVNASDQRLTLIFGSPSSQAEWGRDRIPTTTLEAGAATTVDFNDNNGECQYDLRAVFADSSAAEQRNVNICSISEWRAEPGGGSTR